MTGIFTPAYSVSKRTGSDGNHRRLLEPIGHVPPAEFEVAYWRREAPRRAAGLKDPSLH
jgi:hypothetical protein